MSVLKFRNPETNEWQEITTIVGPSGPAGYTPVKGTDYFTEADKNEFIEEIRDKIPALAADKISYNGEIEDVKNIQDAIDFIFNYAIGTDTVEDMINTAFGNIGIAEEGAY